VRNENVVYRHRGQHHFHHLDLIVEKVLEKLQGREVDEAS
jgi:hypothetical protein